MKATIISISQKRSQNFNAEAQHMTSLEIAKLYGIEGREFIKEIIKG